MRTAATRPNRLSRHLHASDLRALALLATQATAGVTTLAEGVHQSVWRTLGAGATPAQARGLTGLVYHSIHGVTQWLGRNVAAALGQLEPLWQRLDGQPEESPERAAVVAALNGALGDRLAAANNPLATPMTLRFQERNALLSKRLQLDIALDLQLSNVSAKLLLVLHGLCMNDLQWNVPGAAGTTPHANLSNHANALADALGYTPVYLRYNTGLHVSDNGQTLAALLEQLLARWPTPITELTVLAHSMGGLVIRSALDQASAAGLQWPRQLKKLIFLGTPHHGAALERAGNWVDVVLGSTPYSRPFAKLGQLRSAGVTDLRYGLVRGVDWQGQDRFSHQKDQRTPLPLPSGVACFTLAACLAAQRSVVADRLVGDGLVSLHSALGQHDTPAHCLQFSAKQQRIVYRTGHLALLGSPVVTAQLLAWLA